MFDPTLGKSFAVMILISMILSYVIIPLLFILLFHIASRLLKFKNYALKTAFICNLANFGVLIAVNLAFFILFTGLLKQIGESLFIMPLLVSFAIGVFLVRRFYNESLIKSFLSLLLAGLFMLSLFLIFMAAVALVVNIYQSIKIL